MCRASFVVVVGFAHKVEALKTRALASYDESLRKYRYREALDRYKKKKHATLLYCGCDCVCTVAALLVLLGWNI